MEDIKLNLSGIVKESIVDGPGIRYVLFTQGCPHKCEGCHNPQTHNYNCGNLTPIDEIINDISKNPLLKGVTISGGEPFMQANQISKLISRLDRNKLDIIVYTGYEFEALINTSNEYNGFESLLSSSDVLIDGKFDINLKSDILPFRGSTNQRSIDCKESIKTGNTVLYSF
jgi:anaerobic ribonucleoside-triphosphate reductase activating protein